MKLNIKAPFKITAWEPLTEEDDEIEDIGRARIRKEFAGELEGTSVANAILYQTLSRSGTSRDGAMKSASHAKCKRSLTGLLAAVLLCACAVARAQDPSPEPATTLRGISLYQQGHTKRAMTALEEAVRLDPTDADAWHYLGLALRHEGKSVRAAEALEEAAKWRFQRFAWVRPGDSLKGDLSVHRDERFAEAVETLEEYLKMKPKEEPLWRERLEAARFYARFYGKKQDGTRVAYSPREVQTSVQILSRPKPALPPKRLDDSGYGVESVVLLVTYTAEGTVMHIITVQAASPEYTRAVIDAARRIRFKPATLNGSPVSVVGDIY